MSLDVYLRSSERVVDGPERQAILIRENGQMREVSRAEWDDLFPDREPVTAKVGGESNVIYSRNITHNLGEMATDAGIYHPLWRPEEVGITFASQLIRPLTAGLALLRSDSARFELLNPSNGWGTYQGLVAFVADYLAACKEHPEATVEVSR